MQGVTRAQGPTPGAPKPPDSAKVAKVMQEGLKAFEGAMKALKDLPANAGPEAQQALGDQMKAAAEKLQGLAKEVAGRPDAAQKLNDWAKELAGAFKDKVGAPKAEGDQNSATTPGQAQPPTTPFDFLIPCQE